jgi:hypothetical protein
MMKTTRNGWMIGLIAVTALATACGDDPDDTKKPAADMSADMSADMTDMADMDTPDTNMPDMGDMNDMADMPAVTADVFEVEPNNVVDEDSDESTAFEAGKSIGGFIAAGAGQNIDQDIFSVELTAGQVFEWEIAALGNGFSPAGVISYLIDEDQHITRVLSGDVGAKRQAYVPVDGKYYLIVIDARANAETPPQHGGPEATYVIKTSVKTLAPTALTVPGMVDGDATNGDVQAYSFTWSSMQVFHAEVIAAREPVGSDYDPELYLVDATGKLVGVNFDIDSDNDNFDAALAARLTSGQQYRLIIDGYANTKDGRYKLVTTEIDDAPDAPGELVVGTPVTGVIAAADAAAETFDSDYFNFVVPAGKTVKVTIVGAGGLQPTAYIPGFFGAIVNTLPVGSTTAFTLHNPNTSDAEYMLVIDDLRNIPTSDMDEPDYVGGAGFTYTITAEEITFAQPATALPITQSASLPIGEYAWYKVTLPANSILKLDGATDFQGGKLAMAFLDEEGFIGLTAPGSLYVNRAARELVVGVVDAYFQGTSGASIYNYTPYIALAADLSGAAFIEASESNNNTAATAQALVLPALIRGEVVAAGAEAGVDYFKVTLTAGQTIALYTSADPAQAAAMMDADTTLTILDAQGVELATNDDAHGDQQFFSALVFTAPADGEYTIAVSAYDVDSVGFYTLRAALVP